MNVHQRLHPPGRPLAAGGGEARAVTLVSAARGRLRAAVGAPVRDRYLESLAVLALGGLVLQQVGGWAGLPLVVPSMPLLFALTGMAVAQGLRGAPLNAWPVLARSMLHLVLPLWGLALVAGPLASRDGAASVGGAAPPVEGTSLLLWFLPVIYDDGAAPGWAVPQAFVSTSLWLVLLSPAMRWLFHRWPLRTLAVPLVSLLAATLSVWTPAGGTGDELLGLVAFAPCWLLGFALADNRIRMIPASRVGAGVLVLLGLGVFVASTYPGAARDIAAVPPAQALWGTAVALLLFRLRPARTVLNLPPWADHLLGVLGARTLTAFLWTAPAVWLAGALIDVVPFSRSWGTVSGVGQVQLLALSMLLVMAAVQLFGWIEGLATGRGASVIAPARLQSWGRTTAALRGQLHRPPRAAAAGGAVVAIVGLAAGLLPAASAGSGPPAPAGVEQEAEHDVRWSPVDDRGWHLGSADTQGRAGPRLSGLPQNTDTSPGEGTRTLSSP